MIMDLDTKLQEVIHVYKRLSLRSGPVRSRTKCWSWFWNELGDYYLNGSLQWWIWRFVPLSPSSVMISQLIFDKTSLQHWLDCSFNAFWPVLFCIVPLGLFWKCSGLHSSTDRINKTKNAVPLNSNCLFPRLFSHPILFCLQNYQVKHGPKFVL